MWAWNSCPYFLQLSKGSSVKRTRDIDTEKTCAVVYGQVEPVCSAVGEKNLEECSSVVHLLVNTWRECCFRLDAAGDTSRSWVRCRFGQLCRLAVQASGDSAEYGARVGSAGL